MVGEVSERVRKLLVRAEHALLVAEYALVVRSLMVALLLNVLDKKKGEISVLKREIGALRVQNEVFDVQAKNFDRLLAGAMLAAEQMYDAKLAELQVNLTAAMDQVAEEKQQLAAEKQPGQAAATERLAFLLGALVSLVVSSRTHIHNPTSCSFTATDRLACAASPFCLSVPRLPHVI